MLNMNKKEKKLGISSWKCGECDFEVSFGKKVHEVIKILSIEEHREKHKSPKPEKKVRIEEIPIFDRCDCQMCHQTRILATKINELIKVLNSR